MLFFHHVSETKTKAGGNINGLVKEPLIYRGIRIRIRWGSKVLRSLQKRNDIILFSLYPRRLPLPPTTFRGKPTEPQGLTDMDQRGKGREGDDGKRG